MHMIYYDINFIKNARIPNNFVLKNGIYYSNKIMVKTKLFPRNIYTERKMHHFLKIFLMEKNVLSCMQKNE